MKIICIKIVTWFIIIYKELLLVSFKHIIVLKLIWLYSFESFSLDGLSLEFEGQQISETLFCILADLNNTLVWMVSTCPLVP